MARDTFELKPASPFRLVLTVWTLRRRPDNVVDRWDGTTYRRVLPLPAGPVEVAVTQVAPSEAARLKVAVAGQPVNAAIRVAVTTALERLLASCSTGTRSSGSKTRPTSFRGMGLVG
jgi:DNA-3-methyladenine glycosylase II